MDVHTFSTHTAECTKSVDHVNDNITDELERVVRTNQALTALYFFLLFFYGSEAKDQT